METDLTAMARAELAATAARDVLVSVEPLFQEAPSCHQTGHTSRQPFSASLTALPGVNVSFFDAAILIVAPVAGLRPSRSGVSCRVGTTRCRVAPP